MLKYFFYSMYGFIRLTPSKDEAPQHIANIILSILFTFNTIFLIDIINNIFGINITFHNSSISNVLIYIFYLIIIHSMINYNNKFKDIINEIDGNKNKKRMSHLLLFSWILMTIIIGFW